MWLILMLASVLAATPTATDQRDVAPLEGERWQALAMITGFHSVEHKKSRLEVRLLEADGSASVAQNPVDLYLVVTNNGTSDGIEHVWRLPRGVAKVKSLKATSCGADVRVETDRIGPDEMVDGTTAKIFRLCFLSPDQTLDTRLTFKEVAQ